MAIPIYMPSLSPTMTEGNLAKWCKNIGEEVKPGDIIAEIETDKATMEIEAVDEGVLEKVLYNDGAEGISVNSLIAILKSVNDTDKEIKAVLDEHKSISTNIGPILKNKNLEKNKIVNESSIEVIKSTIKEEYDETTDSNITKEKISKNNNNRISASPLAKRMALLKNIDLSNINGSGPRGRIIKNDIENYLNKNKGLKNNNNVINKDNFSKKNTAMRKVIAERLSLSKKEVPHFYLSIDCNVDKLIDARNEINKGQVKELKLSINDFIIKAMGVALLNVPEANCSWGEEEIIYYGSVDISVAVAIVEGLFTPVIRNAAYLNLRDISSQMKDYVLRANTGKLLPKDYEGGSFSISNLGMYGIESFSAIINPPQSGILAVGAIIEKAVVMDNEVNISNIMTCQLSGDHRAIDGAVGAKLLKEFKSIIENPVKMIV